MKKVGSKMHFVMASISAILFKKVLCTSGSTFLLQNHQEGKNFPVGKWCFASIHATYKINHWLRLRVLMFAHLNVHHLKHFSMPSWLINVISLVVNYFMPHL
jgi:hypothetical protein